MNAHHSIDDALGVLAGIGGVWHVRVGEFMSSLGALDSVDTPHGKRYVICYGIFSRICARNSYLSICKCLGVNAYKQWISRISPEELTIYCALFILGSKHGFDNVCDEDITHRCNICGLIGSGQILGCDNGCYPVWACAKCLNVCEKLAENALMQQAI